MKIIKNILLGGAVGLAAAFCSVKTEAAQPVVWTANLTNATLLSAAVNTVTSNGLSSVTFSNGNAVQSGGYVDTLQATAITLSAWFNFVPTGPMAAASGAIGPGAVTTYWAGSADLASWVAWTNLTSANLPGSTNVFGGYVKLDASPFRYVAPYAIVYTVTNGVCSNQACILTNALGAVGTNYGLQIKVHLKGP